MRDTFINLDNHSTTKLYDRSIITLSCVLPPPPPYGWDVLAYIVHSDTLKQLPSFEHDPTLFSRMPNNIKNLHLYWSNFVQKKG